MRHFRRRLSFMMPAASGARRPFSTGRRACHAHFRRRCFFRRVRLGYGLPRVVTGAAGEWANFAAYIGLMMTMQAWPGIDDRCAATRPPRARPLQY